MSKTVTFGQELWLQGIPSPWLIWTTSDTAVWILTDVYIKTEDENRLANPEDYHED